MKPSMRVLEFHLKGGSQFRLENVTNWEIHREDNRIIKFKWEVNGDKIAFLDIEEVSAIIERTTP